MGIGGLGVDVNSESGLGIKIVLAKSAKGKLQIDVNI